MSRAALFLASCAFGAGVLLMTSENEGLQLIGGAICFGLGVAAWLCDFSRS